jgi:hypothetical protein
MKAEKKPVSTFYRIRGENRMDIYFDSIYSASLYIQSQNSRILFNIEKFDMYTAVRIEEDGTGDN